MLVSFMGTLSNVYAQESVQSLGWNVEADKDAFYPGEPVLLTLNIMNKGTREEKVDFGMDGIGAFSMKIRDSNDIIIAEGGKIQKFGMTRLGTLLVPSGETRQKSIVLNRWCSTLQRPGRYHIICDIEYRLRSEVQKQPNTIVVKAGPLHRVQLELDIQIIKTDNAKFKEIIESLVASKVRPETQSKGEWLAEKDIKTEMLALTESELAVPYQLKLLKNEPLNWFGPDAVNSLVRSGTLEAAGGLVQIIEDPSIYKENMTPIFIEGVYRLCETGKTEIINATKEFVVKYKRPVMSTPID